MVKYACFQGHCGIVGIAGMPVAMSGIATAQLVSVARRLYLQRWKAPGVSSVIRVGLFRALRFSGVMDCCTGIRSRFIEGVYYVTVVVGARFADREVWPHW